MKIFLANGNAFQARRFCLKKFHDRMIYPMLVPSQPITRTNVNAGRPRTARTVDVEEEILVRVEETPAI